MSPAEGPSTRSPVQQDQVAEEAGVVAVRVVQLLPQLLGVHVKVDADRALLRGWRGRARGFLEIRTGDVIDHADLGLVARGQQLPRLLLPLPPLPGLRLPRRGVTTDRDLQGPGVPRLGHLKQLLWQLPNTLLILTQFQVDVKPDKGEGTLMWI